MTITDFPAPDATAPIVDLTGPDPKFTARSATSKDEAEKRAVFELAACVNRPIRVDIIDGVDKDGEVVTLSFHSPITVTVLTGNPIRWVDNYLDPEWMIDPKSHPGLIHLRSAWVYGPSYTISKKK